MPEQIQELLRAAQALRTVKVDGEYWLTMTAAYNSIMQVAAFLQNQIKEEVTEK